MSTIASHSILSISETVTDREPSMGNGLWTNSHVTDNITWDPERSNSWPHLKNS